jgi:hypothetical protein
MSGPLQNIILNAFKFIENVTINDFQAAIDQNITTQNNIINIEEKFETQVETKKLISAYLDDARSAINSWEELLRKISQDNDIRKAEDKICEKFVRENEINLKWEAANTKLQEMNKLMASTRSLIRREKLKLPETVNTAPEITADLKLPNLVLKKFSGNKIEFSEFLDNFETAVNRSALSNVQKLLYLKMFTENEPNELISGLQR